jgi:hypothetical protein
MWFDEALDANIARLDLTQTEEGFGEPDLPPPAASTVTGGLRELLDDTRALNTAPMVHPYLMYLIQRFARGAGVLRAPSALASVLSVVAVLSTVIAGVSPPAALIAAGMMTVSASQIRYAQEVREYSLSVLLASLLVYLFLRVVAPNATRRTRSGLYLALFFSPLVQYGLVLFSAGVLTALAASSVFERGSHVKVRYLVFAAASLGAGCIATYFLTLRYQYAGPPPYLASSYYDPHTRGLVSFVISQTRALFDFLFPGQMLHVVVAAAVAAFLYARLRWRAYEPIAVLTLTSTFIVLLSAVIGVYPYGGVRQCLFLGPVVSLLCGVSLGWVVERSRRFARAATFAVLLLIIVSGVRSLASNSPYAEIEDVNSILRELKPRLGDDDRVYVYWGAVPAVNFYAGQGDTRFVHGRYHRSASPDYVPEVLAAADANARRLWLLFAHFREPDKRLMLNALASSWSMQSAVSSSGAELFVGHRR